MLEPSEGDASYRCELCSYEAVWPFQHDHHIQRSHMNVYTGELYFVIVELECYPCISCNFQTNYKLELYEHCIRKHGNNEDIPNDNWLETYSCDECKYKSHSSLSAVKHSCETVRKDSPTVTSLPSISTAESDVKPQNVIFIDPAGGLHYDEPLRKGRTEPAIGQSFVIYVTADDVKTFCCSQCSYRSKRRYNLKTHMLTHATSDEFKGFSCTKCAYRSKSKAHLKRHMLTHATVVTSDEINWFSCTKCTYRAKRKDQLKSHMLTHASDDEIDWFSCAKCAYRVKSKGDLKRHMLTHARSDEIEWFNCTKCSYRAKRKDQLTAHSLTHAKHDEIQWFDCRSCSFRTKLKYGLNKHIKRKHGVS